MIETALFSFCTLTAVFAMVWLAWKDCCIFEIDFSLLGAAALAMAAVILLTAGPDALSDAFEAAAITGAITWLAWHWKPGRLGQGDIWLMGFLGLAAGLDHAVPVLAAFVLFCVVTAASYSIARGKRLFQSMFPVALPGMGAAALALFLRLNESREPIEVSAVGAMVLGGVAGGITFIAWRTSPWDR